MTTFLTDFPFPAGIIIAFSLILLSYVYHLTAWKQRMQGRPFPPGPPPLPLVGNLFDVPTVKMWEGYRSLAEKYGDVVHLRVLGQSILALNSSDAIFEYLDKRCATTSSRTPTPLVDLIGQSSLLVFMPYGARWKRFRRAFWQHFQPSVVSDYEPVQLSATHTFLYKLLTRPTQSEAHIRHLFSAIMLNVLYDLNVTSGNDEHVRNVESALAKMSEVFVPGRFAVAFFPFLRHAPAWFPGSGKQKALADCKPILWRMEHNPYIHVKKVIEDQGDSPSVVGKLIAEIACSKPESVHDKEDAEVIARSTGSAAFAAGSDTTTSTLQGALLALSLNPDVVRKAHEELDSVVGLHRLPLFKDLDSLVYVNAIVKEALRWHNALPIGVPHSTTSDDEFRGYFVPSDTMLIPNIWACMHDPDVYPDPNAFRPERFIMKSGEINPDVRDPMDFVFGFGRRICPGRHFAQSTLTIALASFLHVFDIGPPLDEKGNPITVVPAMTGSGMISYPADCRYSFKPRSPDAEALIRAHAAMF